MPKRARKRPVLLVVDDNIDAREVIREHLEHLGCRVRTATNGKEALDTVAASRPCAIITDLVMPELDGWQFLAALRADERLSKIPVLVISGIVHEHDANVRPHAFAEKPLTLEHLSSFARQHCLAVEHA